MNTMVKRPSRDNNAELVDLKKSQLTASMRQQPSQSPEKPLRGQTPQKSPEAPGKAPNVKGSEEPASQLSSRKIEGEGAQGLLKSDKDSLVLGRKKDAERLHKYLNANGVSLAFQIIFAEALQKQLPAERALSYTAHRLKQIGADLQTLKAHKI